MRRSGRKVNTSGTYVYLELIHVVLQQKLAHCKAIILSPIKN